MDTHKASVLTLWSLVGSDHLMLGLTCSSLEVFCKTAGISKSSGESHYSWLVQQAVMRESYRRCRWQPGRSRFADVLFFAREAIAQKKGRCYPNREKSVLLTIPFGPSNLVLQLEVNN